MTNEEGLYWPHDAFGPHNKSTKSYKSIKISERYPRACQVGPGRPCDSPRCQDLIHWNVHRKPVEWFEWNSTSNCGHSKRSTAFNHISLWILMVPKVPYCCRGLDFVVLIQVGSRIDTRKQGSQGITKMSLERFWKHLRMCGCPSKNKDREGRY